MQTFSVVHVEVRRNAGVRSGIILVAAPQACVQDARKIEKRRGQPHVGQIGDPCFVELVQRPA